MQAQVSGVARSEHGRERGAARSGRAGESDRAAHPRDHSGPDEPRSATRRLHQRGAVSAGGPAHCPREQQRPLRQ